MQPRPRLLRVPSRLLALTALIALFALFARPGGAAADPAAEPDKTLSPYFVVEGASPGVEAMPLDRTQASVRITGVIADVTVQQTYRNTGDKTISARYVFPASNRAAVYGMKMTIGARTIEAKIKEREAARQEFEQAKREGKTASLLEQERPNVFTMSVGNILPGDRIEVELRYTELLVPTDGVYELVYPTVVGPRYASATTVTRAATNQFVATGYQRAGAPPSYAFDINVSLDAGMPIQAVESPSHTIRAQLAAGKASATVALEPGSAATGNRDFVLRYQLGGTDIASGLLLYPGTSAGAAVGAPGATKDGFFLMMVQPPRRPANEQIPAREYVFIVDVSGSMVGFPLDVTKRLMRDLLGRLRPTDHFDVLLFSGGSDLYAERSVPATQSEIDSAIRFLERQPGGGGTELLPALQRAMRLPRPSDHVSRTFVVVTDGYISEETAMFDQVRDHLDEANVFAFGIGSSVNRHLIDGLAKAGQGDAFVVLDERDAGPAAAKFRAYVQQPVLTGVKVAFDGLDTYDVEPKVLPDVFAQRPVIVFGKYRGAPRGKVTLTGVSGNGRFVSTIDAGATTPSASNQALAYLWARSRISRLADFGAPDANRKEIVELGLSYNLLTQFTSFIAVHQIVRATGGAIDVDQPQPLPAGVSENAVGMEVGPEPALPIVLALVVLPLAYRTRRLRSMRAMRSMRGVA
jgi:Ca-activated chloride channel homolog